MTRIAIAVSSLAAAGVLAGGAMAARADSPGAVFTLTNSPAGNAVAVFDRSADGSLSPAGTYATGGLGTGGGLGSQGAVVLSDDGRQLLAVNAASDSVSAFAVRGDTLTLLGTVASGGSQPVSLTLSHGLVYVLNAGSLSISGFTLDHDGLQALAGSTRSLSPAAAAPAQVGFSPSGDVLVVTERSSNSLDVFPVGENGLVGAPAFVASNGNVPFGFDWADRDVLVVADANAGPGESAASSYQVPRDGAVAPISGPVLTHQAAACWLVASKDGRYAFTANAGSGSLSTFAVGRDGSLSLAATTAIGAGSHPLDEAVTGDGRFLYGLADGNHALVGYRIGRDGSLTQVAQVGGLPAGAAGLAAG